MNLNGNVNDVYDNQLFVSGTVKTGTKVEVWAALVTKDKNGKETTTNKKLATTTAQAGKYSVKIPRQNQKTVLTVRYANGLDITSERTEVLPGKAPKAPKVKPVLAGATKMTGTALAGGTITVKDAKQKKIATAKLMQKVISVRNYQNKSVVQA